LAKLNNMLSLPCKRFSPRKQGQRMALQKHCECGCGMPVGGRFASGHNIRVSNPVDKMDRKARRQKSIRHGHSGSQVGLAKASGAYVSWRNMLIRCRYPSSPAYRWYGARGITVCERWCIFENFLADMGERPIGFQISRIDNDGNYEPSNCVWEPRLSNLAERNRRMG